jgi:hypothetical protein
MEIAGGIILGLLLFKLLRHKNTARAITKTGNRQVWAQASDTRFPRLPRHTLFGRRKGLK